MAQKTPEIQTLLGGLSEDQFLSKYWQKKPHLIRQAWPGIHLPLSAEELAGLACEDDVDSRLVTNGNQQWRVQNGPHEESLFTKLENSNWTLLIPDCEKFLPELNIYLEPFRFLPNWRIDDLMISFATDGGGVGPHLDEYDVFLLQLGGQRLWEISTAPGDQQLRNDSELAVLENFTADESWTLDPGDMLYLPPGVAHNGIAVGNSFTASIGFRAPLVNNMAIDYAAYLARLTPERYQDQDLQKQTHPGELTDDNVNKIIQSIRQVYNKPTALTDWAGEFLTTASTPDAGSKDAASLNEFKTSLTNGAMLHKSPWSKLLYHRNQTGLTLFADAVSFKIGIDYLSDIQKICERKPLQLSPADIKKSKLIDLLYELYQQGTLLLET